MDLLVLHFERLSAIIENPCNCLHHLEPLRRMVYNFYYFHTDNKVADVERETAILTHVLHKKIDTLYRDKID